MTSDKSLIPIELFFINVKMVGQRVGDGSDTNMYPNYFTKLFYDRT